jgi:hypothetical protein
VVLMATPKPEPVDAPPDFYADIAKEFGLPFNDSVLKEVLRDNAASRTWCIPTPRAGAVPRHWPRYEKGQGHLTRPAGCAFLICLNPFFREALNG